MKIVALDSYTTNPGDLTWEPLEALGAFHAYDRTAHELIVERVDGAEIVLTNKTALTAEVLSLLPSVRYIGVMATGFNVVDVQAARSQGIDVTNVPAYSTASVAQLVMAHLLHHQQHVARLAEAVVAGEWSACPDFCFWHEPLEELDGKTLGLVGYGGIGKRVGALARAFGMQVVVHSRSDKPGVENVSLDELFKRSDVVSLHCPLTDETNQLVNAERLRTMKKTALLINTGRGGLVDEQALADALNDGRIAGASLDVLDQEPPPAGHPLIGAKNCVITPHIGWATKSARLRLVATLAENIRQWQNGTAQNVVN